LAYVAPSGVYFDVEKWRGPSRMGRLSRQSLDDQNSGQRLEHSPDKKSPHDFALWVLNQPQHLMQWDSPWGRGYPGWHIECSAMSMEYLGATLDIHSGGLDHIPVHHENEIAQSEGATGQPFVRCFVHNAFLVGMEGAKISKSAGKFPIVADLVEAGINPLAFRLLCLGAKYRSELAFSLETVRAAERNLEYLYNFAASLPDSVGDSDAEWTDAYRERFHESVNNDLNTPQALASMLELVAEAYRREDRRIWGVLTASDAVFGLRLAHAREEAHRPPPDEVLRLSEERAEARRTRNFKRADEIRSHLLSMGYVVEDTAGGARLKRRWEA
jgi:cysteinyl-tRNA synthetase